MILGGVITWVAISPEFFGMVSLLDEEFGDNLTGDAKETYDSVVSSGSNVMWIIGPVFFITYIVWAILKMSEKERYTGVY